MTAKYFNVKNGLTTGPISLNAANGNITSNTYIGNVVVTNTANLGAVGNLTITGGSANYVLQTNGSGSLSWVAQSGGGALNTITVDNFTGNSVQTVFTLSVSPTSVNNTFVNIDGVFQLRDAYSISGANITFDSAPVTSASIEVTTTELLATGQGSFVTRNYTGNNVQTTFTVTSGVTASSVLVAENGILQLPTTDYTVSGANLIFTTAPASTVAIQIRELAVAVASDSGGSPGGSNTQVQFNDGSSFGGNAQFTYNKTTNLLSVGNVSLSGNIIPSSNNVYSLGNASSWFRDAYIGPGSLYVAGKKVLEDVSGTITFTTDINQNLKISTSGSGDIQFDPIGTGVIAIKGPLQLEAGSNITSSDGGAINFANPIGSDSITTRQANTDLAISAQGTGTVKINDDLTVTGNLIINGGVGNLSVTTLSVEDSIIDISAETTGVPSANAGIRVVRGDSSAVLLRWTETDDAWQFTNDGSAYLNMVGTTSTGNTSLGNVAIANYFSGNGSLLTGITAATAGTVTTNAQPNITSVGSLASLTVSGLITNTGTGIKTSNIQDSSGTITIVTGYGSVSGAVGIYGNITAGTSGTGFFIGNGSYLSGLAGANVTGTVSSATTAGTVTTNAQPNITSTGTLASLTVTGNITSGNANLGNLVTSSYFTGDGSLLTGLKPNLFMTVALSDETTAITTGVGKITFRAPFAMTLYQIPRASLSTASSSGNPAIDINKNGTTIFSTTLTIDSGEKTSTTAATAAVLSTTTFADDDEITMDIDTAGTGATGLKVTLYYRRT